MWTPPQITVEPLANQFAICATNHGRMALAGERIFRAEPWPRIKFLHDDRATADADATTLRIYLNECATGKRKDTPQTRRGWWQD